MQMHAILTNLAFFAGMCTALPSNVVFEAGFDALPAAARAAVGQTPNITHSVTFPFDGSDNPWTWRINVTDLATPNIGFDGFGHEPQTGPFSFSDGTRAVFSQWDLAWPGAGSLEEYLYKHGGNDSSLCYTSIPVLLPQNVTKNYDSNANNGDCASLLGQECSAALVNALSNRRQCNDATGDLFHIDACKSTLNPGTNNFAGHSTDGKGAFSTGLSASMTNASSHGFQSGSAVYSWGVYTNGSSHGTFENVTGAASILGLTKLGGTGSGGTKLLCQVVDKNAAPAATQSSNGHITRRVGLVALLPAVGVALRVLGLM